MTTLTVNIDNKKAEKAIKAVLDALGLNYNIEQDVKPVNKVFNKTEQRIYNNLKNSAEQIKLYKEGKLELRDASALLDEL